MKLQTLFISLVAMLSASATRAQVVLDFDLTNRGPAITDNHYGVFYEEISRGGDGGLYAEMVCNRSFEDNASNPDTWWTVGNATFQLTTDNLLNANQGHALIANMKAAGSGIRNEGYYGMTIRQGTTYKLSFWLRTLDGYDGAITAQLQNGSGSNIGQAVITPSGGAQWTKYTATITATGSATTSGYLALLGSKAGSVAYDVVSLFPPTWKDRDNGCRIDIAEKIAAMHPAFVRFPGGCYIEGWEGDGSHNRFEWKKSVGPIEERPGHQNRGWGYHVNDGLGYQELLQFTEDLGADALFVVNMGFGHDWDDGWDAAVTTYLQEALDAIEFAIGDTTTTYGALRAQYGHPAPYPLKYIEIGNENEGFNQYAERHYEFYKAIKGKYPQLTLVTDGISLRTSTPMDIGDWHDYTTPSWMIGHYNRFDNRSRASAKVYEGEYAVTQNGGWRGNLNAAIGEAVYMEGMENNSDVCVMASYAPLLCNEGRVSWHPNAIWFNSDMSYGNPSYHVQCMFANNIGKENVKWTERNNVAEMTRNTFGLATWNTTATYTDVKLADGNNVTVVDADTTAAGNWTAGPGSWSRDGGSFAQSDAGVAGATYIYAPTHGMENYTLSLKATKNSGSEGFLIIFDYRDANNYAWWNVGGWNNTSHAVEQSVNGQKSTVGNSTAGTIETGKTYEIKIVKTGNNAKCYLDGELTNDVTLSDYVSRNVYTAASVNDETNEMFIKLVNPSSSAKPTVLRFQNGKPQEAVAQVLTSGSGTDENTPDNPTLVSPKEQTLAVTGDSIVFDISPLSVNVVKVKMTDIGKAEPARLPGAKAVYTFEGRVPADDSGTYTGSLQGGAKILTLSDGNHALYSGKIGGKGYMSLGNDVVQDAIGKGNSCTVSMNILTMPENNLSSYSWALSMDNGTANYMGFINAGGANNWYFEIVGSAKNSLSSGASLTVAQWHNLTFTADGTTGRFYIDGFKVAEQQLGVTTSAVVRNITGAYIAKSPFSADAIMENCYFDDLRFYDVALSEEQVKLLYDRAAKKAAFINFSTDTGNSTAVKGVEAASDRSARHAVYGIDGQQRQHLLPGLNIVSGEKGGARKVIKK